MSLNLCDSCMADCRHEQNPHEIVVKCGAYRQPLTNADRIRSMTNEELAEMILDWQKADPSVMWCHDSVGCDGFGDDNFDCTDAMQLSCIAAWLKEGAK